MENKIIKVEVGELQSNCYIVIDNDKRGVLVDPGSDFNKISDIIKKEDVFLQFILLTHGHFDHIEALPYFNDKRIYIHTLDYPYLFDDNLNLISRVNRKLKLNNKNIVKVEDGDKIPFLSQEFEVIHTPGHTEGSCIYKLNDVIFTGDTIFKNNIGRCDLVGGDLEKMRKTTQKIAKIKGDYKLCPGHGETTTLEFEKINNPYLRNW